MFDTWVFCGASVAVIALSMGCKSRPFTLDFGDGGVFSSGPWFDLPTGPRCPGSDDAGVVAIDAGANYDPGACSDATQRCVAYATSCIDNGVEIRAWECSCLAANWSCAAAAPVAFSACESASGVDSGTE
jgi:hypothetical protein